MISSLATQAVDLNSFTALNGEKERRGNPYSPFVEINFNRKNLTVKTVEQKQEFFDALKLRYRVFHEEKAGSVTGGIDRDIFDDLSDILIIKDSYSAKVIGTYRLISEKFSSKYYSESEFNLDSFIKSPGEKLELGRACIDFDFRTGTVIHLLWRGISEYAVRTDSRYLFGCSSIFTQDKSLIAKVCRYLASGNLLSNDYNIQPMEKYQSGIDWDSEYKKPMSKADRAEAETTIPALMKSYLKAGAKIYGSPAYDSEFKCFDLFTVLDLSKLTEMYRKKYR